MNEFVYLIKSLIKDLIQSNEKQEIQFLDRVYSIYKKN